MSGGDDGTFAPSWVLPLSAYCICGICAATPEVVPAAKNSASNVFIMLGGGKNKGKRVNRTSCAQGNNCSTAETKRKNSTSQDTHFK